LNSYDPKQLWQDIVCLTKDSEHECIRSLRIPLFMLLQAEARNSFPRQVRRLLSASRLLLPMRTSTLPPVEKGRIVVLFAHRTPSNLQNLLPVARDAHQRGLLGGIVAAGDCGAELQEFSGSVPIVTVRDLVAQLGIRQRYEIESESLSVFREIAGMLWRFDRRLARRLHRNAGIVLAELSVSLQMELAFQNLFEAWSPSCVASTSDLWPVEYQFAYRASASKIPSVVIQHGSLIYFYWPFRASLYVLWGQESLQEMLAFGASPESLVVGGMPASDGMFGQVRATPASRESRPGRPVCLILSQTHGRTLEPELFASYKRFLSELLPSTPFVRWKVKLHPSENRSFYDDLAPEAARRLEFYPPSTSLEDALREADTVTTLYSTSGLQAMIAGHPLIIPCVSPRMTDSAVLPRIKGAMVVHSTEEFGRELAALIADPNYRAKRVETQRQELGRCFANQGHAAGAITDLLQEQAIYGDSGRRVSAAMSAASMIL
jgi:hypothetical protein